MEEGGKTLYSLTRQPTLHDSETLFHIRIGKTEKEFTKSLFALIRNRWKELNGGRVPGATQVQKVAVEVANRLSLPVPRAWYLYGPMSVLVYDQKEDYDYNERSVKKAIGSPKFEKLNPTLDSTIKEFSKFPLTRQLLKHQYKKAGNEMYLCRLELKDLLHSGRYARNSKLLDLIRRTSYFLLNCYVSQSNREEVNKLVKDYVSTLNQVLLQNSLVENEDTWVCIDESFIRLWEVLALTNFIDSLSDLSLIHI